MEGLNVRLRILAKFYECFQEFYPIIAITWHILLKNKPKYMKRYFIPLFLCLAILLSKSWQISGTKIGFKHNIQTNDTDELICKAEIETQT